MKMLFQKRVKKVGNVAKAFRDESGFSTTRNRLVRNPGLYFCINSSIRKQ
jgi:hypothetical protein